MPPSARAPRMVSTKANQKTDAALNTQIYGWEKDFGRAGEEVYIPAGDGRVNKNFVRVL